MRWLRWRRLARVAIVASTTIFAVTCVRSGAERCEDGSVCREGASCVPLVQFGVTACVVPDQLTQCEGLDDGIACTIAGVNGTCYGGACHVATCGDRIVDISEACDVGDRKDGDGCSADCRSTEVCGNGIIDVLQGEECDQTLPGLTGDGCTSRCAAEFRVWREVSPGAPPRRAHHAMATDPQGGVLVFGGTDSSGNTFSGALGSSATIAAYGDLWRWNGDGWARVIATAAPPRRALASFSLDPERGRAVLFGGIGPMGALADLWEWDGVSWTEKPSAQGPTPRGGASLACGESRCVLFGGGTGSGSPPSITFHGDTWSWDGTSWTMLSPFTAGLGARARAAMSYDASRKTFVLFGGEGSDSSGTVSFTDAWALAEDSSAWTQDTGPQVTIPTAPAGVPALATYDAALARTVLVAGGKTYERRANQGWMEVTASPSMPYPAMAYDAHTRNVVAFGMNLAGNAKVTHLGSGAWNDADPSGPQPASTRGVVAAYDPRRGRVVALDDRFGTWVWTRTWQRLIAADVGSTPRASVGAALAYDAACGELVTFGGIAAGTAHDETWIYDGGWRRSTSTATQPSPRSAHAMTYDAARRVIVMFGGGSMSSFMSDVWEWRGTCGAKDWVDVTPVTGPSARSNAALAFDERSGRSILFGGFRGFGADGTFGDTWAWDGTAWTELAPAAAPSARLNHAMAFDPLRRQIVLFGGRAAGQLLNDAWEWDAAASTWKEIAAVANPSPREGMAMTQDATGGLLLIGGTVGIAASNDLYRLRSEQSLQPPERCLSAELDDDLDGLAGCADPDCWSRCAPLCALGTSCAGPSCGDGTCDPVEDYRICPQDCTAM